MTGERENGLGKVQCWTARSNGITLCMENDSPKSLEVCRSCPFNPNRSQIILSTPRRSLLISMGRPEDI